MGTDRLRWIYRAYRYRYKLEKQEIRLLLDHLAITWARDAAA